jgi:hypothetical protein
MADIQAGGAVHPLTVPAAYERPGGALAEGGLIAAVLTGRTSNADKLKTDDKQMFALPPGSVKGEVGGRVYFEASRTGGGLELKQIFPGGGARSFDKAMYKQLSVKNIKDMMSRAGIGTGEAAKEAREAGEKEKARIAAVRVKNSVSEAGKTAGDAAAKLAAMGLNVEKLTVHMIRRIVSELAPEIEEGADPADISAAVRLIQASAELTKTNIRAAAAAPPARVKTGPEVWGALESKVLETLTRLGFAGEVGADVIGQAFAANGIELTGRNFEKAKMLIDGGAAETTRRRQLAEARLHWANETAGRLGGLGVDLDTEALSKQLEALKALEAEDMKRALRQAGADATEENAAEMADTFRAVKLFPMITYAAFEAISAARAEFTVKGAAGAISDSYETSATVPSAKYGEGFAKVAKQVSPLLKDLNIADSEPNVRAAGILIKNNMDVTPDSVADIRDIDAKVQTVSSRLHPIIAAKMISEGLKPSELHIDGVIAYIEKFHDQYGVNDGDRLSRYIRRLDAAGEVSDWARHRDEIMRLYQALYRVSRDGGASLALSVKTGIEPTLKALTEQADIYKSGRARFYQRKSVSDAVEKAAPEAAARLIAETGLEVTADEAAKRLESYAVKTQEAPENAAEALLEAEPALLAALENAGIPITAGNAARAKRAEQPGALAKCIIKLAGSGEGAREAVMDALDGAGLETLKAGERPEARLARAIESMPPGMEADEVLQIMRVQAALDAASKTRRVAFKLNGRPAEAKVTVINSAADAAAGFTALLSVDTAFGPVSAVIDVKDGNAETRMFTENPRARELLEGLAPKLAAELREAGFEKSEFRLSKELEAKLIGA